MSEQLNAMATNRTRPDYIPVGHYLDPDFAKLEVERFWPRVWQIAGRAEHLRKTGDFFVYDIADQSIIVTRVADGRIKAYYNACKHRGRQLVSGRGNAAHFRCNYHGWTWGLEGEIRKVLNREDWDGCPKMADADLAMDEVLVDTWAGFVFVNLDPGAEPLREFLGPVPDMTGWFRWEDLRHKWHRSFPLKCNWKVAIEAFMESYHVTSTHSQYAKYQDTTGHSRAQGNHGHTGYWGNAPVGIPSPDSNAAPHADQRVAFIEALEALQVQVDNMAERDVVAARRVLTETSPETPMMEVFMKAESYMRDAALAEGIDWPSPPPEVEDAYGAFWNISPNVSLVTGTKTGTVMMRSRPLGTDPNMCLFDVAALHRYPPGGEPAYAPVHLDDWRVDRKEIPLILAQDFAQVELVHAGMKSRKIEFCRMNPHQERQITNMHQLIERYVFD
ncbi:MAG: aromatic ring-hydroxylating dioxygenase subunit alpha [Alphaproteobacteria bacterium]|nr:aromatic ring-hydroxylating dioxygenase subunit alpha [Alphaproteobacteria bacterium]